MAVTYTPQTWNDDDPTTPVDSARLGHMESGISAVATEINNHETSVAQQFTALNGTFASINARPYRRVDPTLAFAANAASALTISTPDSTGQVVEPAIEYVPAGWNGHRYWALVSGYADYDATKETPSIYYSDDGQNFTPVPGAPFPLQPTWTDVYDPELRLGPDGKMHGFFCRGPANLAGTTKVYWTYSSDGVNWSTPVVLFQTNNNTEAPIGPVFLYDEVNNQWICWYTDDANFYNSVNAVYPFKRRTCPGSSPGGTWSAGTACTLNNLPASRATWEAHIERAGTQLHMVTTLTDQMATGTNSALHFATSDDNGVTWNFNSSPLLSRGSGSAWDSNQMYRADLVALDGPEGAYGLWYSASKGIGGGHFQWGMGYTTIKVQPDLSQVALPRYQQFTAGGTWTVPAGITRIRVRCTGAGGGGGGGGSSSAGSSSQVGGAGGGAGAVVEQVFTVTPGHVLTAVVGTGGTAGTAGAAGGNAGGNGGNGSVSTLTDTTASTLLLAADGGSGGLGSAASSTAVVAAGQYAGSTLGSTSTTAANFLGGGGQSTSASGQPIFSVVGGGGGGPASSSGNGGGGGNAATSSDIRVKVRGGTGASGTLAGVNGVTATQPGCGGGGGGGGQGTTGAGGAGGAGANGLVEIFY